MRPVPGSAFGAYQILAELGQGGMGHVFTAHHLALDRQVALKVLGQDVSGNQEYRQRFVREARAAARLNHRNIVQIYDFGEIESTAYLAMEFVPGASLGDRLRTDGKLSETEAISVIRQACAALGVAHAAGLVHRDVKPDNLILRNDGVLKLIDLGIAKNLSDDQGLTQTGIVSGTPHYISPEQIEGCKDIDGRADVYSLGATLFHLVTGETPFEGSSPMVVVAKHLHDRPKDPRACVPQLSEGLCDVISWMMARNRDERCPDMAAADLELARIEENGPSAGLAARRVATPVAAPDAESTRSGSVAWDPTVLEEVQQRLADAIGPVAGMVVRKASATASDLEQLCSTVARQIPSDRARAEFLSGTFVNQGTTRAVADRRPSPSMTTGKRTSADPVKEPAGIVFEPAALQVLERRLAASVGPVARILVKKAAHQAATWDELIDALSQQLPNAADRSAFRDDVRGMGR
jgi:serine/threonine-protein kinase